MATEIVIASAARTPIGSFNGAFGAVPAHDLGKVAIKGALERAKVKPEEVDEVIMGQILSAASGPEPGPPGRRQFRHPGREDRARHQPALRLGPARRRLRLAGDPQRRRLDHGGRRPGEHEPGAARRLHARRHQDGRVQDDRHHAEGRPVGRLPRLSHGQHRRERGAEIPDHPRRAGRLCRVVAEQGRGGAEVRPLQGRDRPGHGEDPQGRGRGRHRRIPAPRHDRRDAGQAASGLHQGRRLGHRRQRLGHQ